MLRLYTFYLSHYSEKARWALDYKRLEYKEHSLLPGPHARVIKRIAPKTSVPVLEDGDTVIQGSSAILDYLEEHHPEPPLSPASEPERREAAELERRLDAEIGETIRRIFYFYALPHRKLVAPLLTGPCPSWVGALYGLGMYPLVRRAIRSMYKVTADNVEKDKERFAATVADLDRRLERTGFLVGDRFTRADLTLAALVSPMWRPPQHPVSWPAPDLFPAELDAWSSHFADTRVRKHVLDLYTAQRHPAT